jgi:hypothetical protein
MISLDYRRGCAVESSAITPMMPTRRHRSTIFSICAHAHPIPFEKKLLACTPTEKSAMLT